MRLKKKHFFQLHSWIGTRLSILFFIVCFSGTIATLSNELDWLFMPDIRLESTETSLASKNQIVQNIKNRYPEGKIQYWDHREESYLCDIVYVGVNGARTYVFVNPYTGEIQGNTQLTFQRFFRDLHYYLFIPFQIGHFTVLIFGFLLLISLITALYFYKKWWKKFLDLKTGKGKLVLFRSLHRLVGLWSIPFTILFSITAIWYFLERTNTAGISDISNPGFPEVQNLGDNQALENLSYTIDYDKAVSIAKKEIPKLKIGTILPPSSLEKPIYITGKSDVALVRKRANRIYINPTTYQLVDIQRAENTNTVMWLNDIADPLHFGYWGGLITKLIWFIFGLGISGLVLTGIWITLKRQAIKKKEKQKPVMGIWKFINWGIFLVLAVFMYIILITRYKVSMLSLVSISLGWLILCFLAYYVFEYRLQRIASEELKSKK